MEEPIHLSAAAYVGTNFTKHFFLRLGEVERQNFAIKAIEILPYVSKNMPPDVTVAQTCIAQQMQLQIEKLFEFKAHLCPAQVFDMAREVYVIESIVDTHEVTTLYNDRSERLF